MAKSDSKNIWIIAGEDSGDHYGAQLAKKMHVLCPQMHIGGMGGTQMKAAGIDIYVDSTDLGIVGLVEVLKQIGTFIRLLRFLTAKAAKEKPDAVILIDYPGFNIRLAQRLHKLGIPVIYYISPQVWAWKKKRIRILAANVTRLLCIFPFEPKVYEGSGLDVRFVGHPLLQTLAPMRENPPKRDPKLILLLPGSRTSELQNLLPAILQAAKILHQRDPALHFEMPLSKKSTFELAENILQKEHFDLATFPLSLTIGNTRECMQRAIAGIAASGTVTVEACILGLPLCVTYKMHWLTWRILKMLVKLKWGSIANLVSNKCVYEEYMQKDCTPQNLAAGVQKILPGGERREGVLNDINNTIKLLGGAIDVTAAATSNILEVLYDTPPKFPI
ncbi:MAG: lipid-A-disaccharide synthase [Lentisphaeria bacterium]